MCQSLDQAEGPKTKLWFPAWNKLYFIKSCKAKLSNEEHLIRKTLILKSLFFFNLGCAGSSLWGTGFFSSMARRLSCLVAWRILVPWPGIEPLVPCIGRMILNHWTTREVSWRLFWNTDSSFHFLSLSVLCFQFYYYSSSHVWMWELDHKEGWALKNWCFWTVVLEKTLENSLNSKEIKPVNPKGNQSRIFIGRTDAKAEASILWPPDTKNWLIGKDPDAVKDWGQEEKGTTEVEMVGWHHWLNGHDFEQTLVVDEGEGSLVCSSPWGYKGSDKT